MATTINFNQEKNKIILKGFKEAKELPLKIKRANKTYTFVTYFNTKPEVTRYNKIRSQMGFSQASIKKGNQYFVYSRRR